MLQNTFLRWDGILSLRRKAGRDEIIFADNRLVITNSLRHILYIVKSVGDIEKPANQNQADPEGIYTVPHSGWVCFQRLFR